MTNPERARTENAIAGGESNPATVTPRWEWRTFAHHLAPRGAGVIVGPSDSPQDEVYLVAAASPQNVKIRREHLEIKQLDEIDAGGLERWRPVARFAFPLGRAELDCVGRALGTVVPAADGAMDRAALRSAVIAMHPRVVAIPVTKRRSRFVAAGCQGEKVELLLAGERWESIALEDANPAVVGRGVHLLQMDHLPNTNYPAALKAIAGIRSVETPLLSQEPF